MSTGPKNELKIMCPSCHHRVATVRRVRGSQEVVYCEGCDEEITLEEWLGWKHQKISERSLLLDTGEIG